jgi:hypothetical protein
VGVYHETPVEYVSTATMVLTTTEYGGSESQDPSKPTDLTNSMLNFNQSLKTTSAILIESMSTKEVAVQVGAVGPTTLLVDDGSSNPHLLGLDGPFLSVTATSTSPQAAHEVAVEARQLLGEKLRAWQAELNAPDKTYVNLADVVSPTAAEPDHAPAVKRALAGTVGGLILGLGAAYAGTRLLQLRRRRRSADPGGDAVPVAAVGPSAPAAPAAVSAVVESPVPSLKVAEAEVEPEGEADAGVEDEDERPVARAAAFGARLRKS